MKKLFLIAYAMLRWLLLILLLVLVFLFFILESPSTFLNLAKSPLKEMGIEYSSMKGGLLSGFVLEDVNYKNKLQAKEVALKIDLNALENRVLHIDKLVLKDAHVEKDFLASLLENNNSEAKKSESNTTLPFDRVVVKEADISLQNITYDAYHVNRAVLHMENFDSDMKTKHKGEVTFKLDSNVSQVELKGSFENENYDVIANIEAEKSFIAPFVKEQNITLLSNPKVYVEAKGDLKKLDYKLEVYRLDAKQNAYELHSKTLETFGHYHLEKKELSTTLKSELDSNVGALNLTADASLNLDDLNNSLVFKVKSDFKPKESPLLLGLDEQNISIEQFPLIEIFAKGDMKEVTFNSQIKGLKATQNDLEINLKAFDAKGKVSPLKGDTELKISSLFDSSVADGEVDLKMKLNFNDVNNTLNVDSIAKLNVHANYVNPLLKEQNMELQGDTPMELRAKGSMDNLLVNFDAKAKVLKDKKLSNVTVHSSPIRLNLINTHVDGSVKIESDGDEMGINMEINFSGDYTKPKAMKVKNKIEVGHFNAFGVNLNALQPLDIDLQNGAEGMVVTLDSPKLKLVAKSTDNDHYRFKLHTQELQLSKIIELPAELKDKFVKTDIEGEATLSTQYFKVQGTVGANENFMATIDAQNNATGLVAKLFTQHLKLKATGDLKSKNLKAHIAIDSLEKVQEEFKSVYPFSVVKVDGALDLDVALKEEKIVATLASKKLAFDGFNIENLKLNAEHENELLSINTFNFNTTGFKDKSLNQKFYLNQKGLVHLGEKRDVFLDIHPNILVKATGTSENLEGNFKIKKLPLGHQDYGDMVLNCDINYKQFGLKKEIRGDVRLEKMKLFYEAKFLDADYDSDVVVITKRDKNKKKERDSFLEDTLIDLAIYAPDAKYTTRDIDLKFTVDVNAKKEFGQALGMLGQVKEINGRVEQAPKLFTVVDSNIVFGGGKEINPLLDIQVDYELPDVLISILIHGNAKRPKINFSSEPPMPKKDILSYLLLGVSTAALGEGEGSLAREAQLFVMNQAARDFAYEVELDRVFIKDDGTGEGYAIQVGKKVNEKTMAIVETSKEGNSFILEYEVNKNIKVEVGQHQKVVPSQSIDVFFRKKFK